MSTSWVVNSNKMDIFLKKEGNYSPAWSWPDATEPSLSVFQNKVMNIDAVKVKLQVRELRHLYESAVVPPLFSKQNKTKPKNRSWTASRGVSASHTSSFPAAGG